MNEHLEAAVNFSRIGADHLDNGRFERGMEYLLLAETAAAIAQAEAAERQAVAMERIAITLDRMSCEETVNGDLAFSVKLWGER